MKYLLRVLICLLAIFLLLKFVIHLLDDGHEITYNVGNFKVIERYDATDNNYSFVLKHNKFKLNFDVTADYNKAEAIINKIDYKKINGYECAIPIFKNNKILTDIMCKKGDVVYYAHDLDGKISDYAKKMAKYGYNSKNYQDQAKKTRLSTTTTVYQDNILENHYLALESYKGLVLYNSDNMSVNLFDNDVYKKPISVFTDKYYVVADYNSQYTFKIFKVVNIINGTEKEVRSYDEISFDSVIQGVVDGEIYLFDKDAKVQYKVNLDDETVEKVSNDGNVKYYNGKWNTMSLTDALKDKKFDNYYVNISGYDKADKVGKYYYVYKKQDSKYLVYKTYNKKVSQKTYLFTTSDINSIIYTKNYIYFRDGNVFYYWSNKGVRKVIENTELEFNDDISLGVYAK